MSKNIAPSHVPVGDYLEKVKTCSPAAVFKDELFDYLDISSVDRDSKTITGATKIKGVEAPSRARQVVQAGDVLVSTVRPNLNAVAQVGDEYHNAVASTGFCVLRPKKGILHSNYLLHWVKSPTFINDMVARATGANYPAVSDKTVKTSLIPLPSFEEQQRIADTLDTADALRRKDQELLRKYNELAQSIFHETFGELNAHNGDYSVVHLRDLADATSGITKNARLKPEDMVEVPYLRVANVQDGYLNLDEIKTITASARDVAKYQLQTGDIVITEGGDPDKLGRGTVWNEEVSGCSFQNHIFRIRVTDDRITPYFLSKVIGSKYGKAYFLKAAKQTTGIATINSSQLKAFPVILPPKRLQMDYEAKMARLSAQKQLVTSSAAASNHLLQNLLQSSFA
jgi:type I restriction enzyme S subunit